MTFKMGTVEARRLIIKLYNTEFLNGIGGLETRNEKIGAIPFYGWLTRHHPEALKFDFPGDKYQQVKLWVGLP